jgi:hypothetical protein
MTSHQIVPSSKIKVLTHTEESMFLETVRDNIKRFGWNSTVGNYFWKTSHKDTVVRGQTEQRREADDRQFGIVIIASLIVLILSTMVLILSNLIFRPTCPCKSIPSPSTPATEDITQIPNLRKEYPLPHSTHDTEMKELPWRNTALRSGDTKLQADWRWDPNTSTSSVGTSKYTRHDTAFKWKCNSEPSHAALHC